MADYPAGRLLVAVVPDMRGAATKVRKEFSGLGPYDVPVTVKADTRAIDGIRTALRSLPDVVLTADSSAADREIAELRARLMSLADQTVGVDISAADAHRELDSIRADLDRLAASSPDIAVRVDAGAASAALDEVTAQTGQLDGKSARIKVDADTRGANASLAETHAAAGRLNGRRFGFRVVADVAGAVADVAMLGLAVNQFANRDYRFRVEADTAGAVASVAKLVALVSSLGGLAGVVGGLAGAIGGIGAAGAVGAAGLGATVLASLGVGKALSAMSAQQDSAASTARQSAKQQQQAAEQVRAAYDRVQDSAQRVSQARSDAAKNNARAEAEAEKSIDAARRQAASSIASAMASKEAADRRVSRSTRDLRSAQSELTSAWEAGKRSLQDLQDQLDSSQIDQRQAAADLKQARKDLDEARASGDADAVERAQIAYDRQVETIDQLAKRTNRLRVDNQKAQQAGVAGSDQYRAALDRVAAAEEQRTDAVRTAGEAQTAVEKARADGARSIREAEIAGQQRVDDAREQGNRAVTAAIEAATDAQRAYQQALAQTADAGSSAADKVATAFAALSPAAAEFARYLFGLQGVLEGLSATAAAGLFPPLQAGIATLLTQLPLINTVVGQLAAGMGAGLNLVLTQLASPFWASFFGMLGNAAGSVIPQLFGSVMTLAGAAATLITALMPIVPASLAILDALSGWIAQLSGPLVQALAGMFPAVHAFISALGFLGPLLVALSPILNALGIAFSQVLGAFMQALIPILTALTPLFQAFAQQLATQLVGALQAATPFLVTLATWMSQNPGLVLGVIGAIGGLLGALKPLAFVAGLVAAALHAFVIRAVALAVLSSVGLQATVFGRAIMLLLSPLNLAQRLLPLIGRALMFVGRALLAALGPVGWLITGFTLLYSTSEPFRNAVNQLVGVLMGLVGTLVGAVMPIFDAASQAFSLIAGVVGQLVSQLAVALIPVINLLAGVLGQLVGSLLPPLMQIVGALVPVIAMLGQTFAGLLGAVLGPVIGALQKLISAVLPPLIFLLQNVVLPVISFLADLFATVLAWTITNVVVPAIQFLVPIISWLVGVLTTGLVWVIDNLVVPALNFLIPIFQWVGEAAMWLWTNAIKPAFDFIGAAAKVLMVVIGTVLIAPLLIAWNLIAAAATWLWENVLRPVFQAIGDFITWVWTALLKPAFDALVALWRNVLAPALNWLWTTIFQPVFQAIGDFVMWVWNTLLKPTFDAQVAMWRNVIAPALMWLWQNIVKPAFEGIGSIITWVWENVIRPAFDAVMDGLDWLGRSFEDATNWIRDIWNRIRGYLAKPINFMIETVWNNGVVPAWNAVAGLVGLGPIAPLNKIPEARTGGRVDSRGMIHGPGTGTSDSILARVKENDAPIRVGNREFIMNERATKANLPVLTAMNGGARIGDRGNERRAGAIPAFAGGGPVWQGLWNTVRGQFPRARLTDSTRPGANDYHGRGMAIDIAGSYPMAVGQMLDINKWIGTRFPGSTELIHYPVAGGGAINLKNGGPHTYGLSTQLSHANHVHWAQDPANPQGGGNGGGAFAPISTYFMDAARGAFDKFTNGAIDAMRAFAGPPPPRWREAVPALATKVRDTVRDFVFGKAGEKDAAASAGAGAGMMGPVGDGEIFVIGQIADSARAHGVGFDGAAIGVATGIVESGLRNLNYGDRDSLGVFQQRPSQGWGSPAQVTNVRYAADQFFNRLVGFNWRGMDPGAAAQRVQRSAFPARYGQAMGRARDLLAQHGGVFDQGGVARGKGLMFKDVIRDERVLDPIQTGEYDTLTAYRRMIDEGRLVPGPTGPSAQQIAAMAPGRAAFPTEFTVVSGRVEIGGDGLGDMVDVRLRAVEQLITTGMED